MPTLAALRAISADGNALSSDEEDSDGERANTALTEAGNERVKYQQRVIKMEVERMKKESGVPVPITPAPAQDPDRIKKIIPNDFIIPDPPSTLERTLNSSLGRGLTVLLTVVNFLLILLGTVSWNAADRWLAGEAIPILLLVGVLVVVQFTALPALADISGLMPAPTGVDWKPYLVLYRLGFFLSVPAIVFMHIGPGDRASHGFPEGGVEDISITELTRGSYKWFRAHDGFVALNLTKGITETLERTEHNVNVLRSSRFRDAEIVNNREPFSNEVEPTVPPGFQETYRIAPVFLSWAPCVTRYRISGGCLKQNEVAGWAIAVSRGACTNLRMVSCRRQDPILHPTYRCATSPVKGREYADPIQGLCGRSTLPPRDEVIDELSALLLLDGWPEASLPNSTHGWFDVSENDCIADIDECEQRWTLYEQIGLSFVGVTILLTVLPFAIDWSVDSRFRNAIRFNEDCKKRGNKAASVF
eukprot:TRINITY_DN1369_c0_g1_i1.p1 TRINITY_DN1369_c0_g1~~TRINITY_DN1369_c0_g1_i1.p1  ORF type:complete len:490 (+),score=51.60 TRINITY_DN1369_c0_g1_i1:48-1472(+)